MYVVDACIIMQWSISYTDVFGKKKVESFESQGEAQARYEALIPRTYGDLGDLVSVTAPIKSAVKVSESVTDVDLSNQWDDLEAVVKGLFIRGFDNPRGNYFYVKTLYSNPDEATYSVYSRGSDSLMLEIHVLGDGDSPCVAVVNQGLQDKAFEKACSVIEPVMKDWFSMVTDGFHGSLAYIDTPSEYALWKKSKGFKNEDGASAASLGAVPTATVRPSNKREAKKKFDYSLPPVDPKVASAAKKAITDAVKAFGLNMRDGLEFWTRSHDKASFSFHDVEIGGEKCVITFTYDTQWGDVSVHLIVRGKNKFFDSVEEALDFLKEFGVGSKQLKSKKWR